MAPRKTQLIVSIVRLVPACGVSERMLSPWRSANRAFYPPATVVLTVKMPPREAICRLEDLAYRAEQSGDIIVDLTDVDPVPG